MFVTLAGLGYIIWSTTVAALHRLDDIMIKMQGGATNLQEMSGLVDSKMFTKVPYYDAVFYIIIGLWIFAIIDAYRIGKQKEIQNRQASEFANGFTEKPKTKED